MTLRIEQNGAVVIERGIDGNVPTGDWFSVWSDGWIEQGGQIKVTSNGRQEIKYKRIYKNSYQAVYASIIAGTNVGTVQAMSSDPHRMYIFVQNASEANPVFIEWQAKGY